MLSPNYLKNCTEDIVRLYQGLEDDIIRDIVRRIVNTDFKMTQSAVYQAEMLQEAGMLGDEMIKRVAAITKKSDREIKKLFEEAGMQSMAYDDRVYKEAGLEPVPVNQSPEMLQILSAGVRKTNADLNNLTKTTALTAQTAYIQACNTAYMQVSSGAFDYNSAVINAVAQAAKVGAWVVYPSGARSRVDVAVRRSTLTGVNQTVGTLQEMRMDEMGCSLVETTAHVGARPEHTYWQGKIFSYKGRNKKYPDFVASTGYGSVGGLMGANCRHGYSPFFEGISRPNYTDAQLKEMAAHTVQYNGKTYTDYEASQMQRKLERDIRGIKRNLAAWDQAQKNGLDVSAQFEAESVKLKEKETALQDFLKQTLLAEDKARVQVQGFGRSQAKKAAAANKKAVDKADREQYDRYLKVLGKENLPKTFDKFKDLKYNNISEYNRLKDLYRYENKPYLQEQLAYITPNGEKNFIPNGTVISSTKTIAGAGSKTELRVEKRLVEMYGGSIGEWKKRVGKVESSKYIFDVHWYELNGKQYRMKLKSRSDKK